MRDQEHNYEIIELKMGFKIVPRDENRPTIVVGLNPTTGFWHYNIKKDKKVPMYAFYYLLDYAVELLYETWIPPKTSDNQAKENAIGEWARRVTSKTLNKKVHSIWKKCCENSDPLISELHRKLYAVANGKGNWDVVRKIIQEKDNREYLIKDLLKYKAARMSFLMDYYYWERYDSFTNESIYNFNKDWKKAFSDEETTYTSLLKTLTNFSGGVIYYDLFALKHVRLNEPVYNRLRLMAYCFIGGRFGPWNDHERIKIFSNVVCRSSDEDIKRAIQYIWQYVPTEYTGDFRKPKGIAHAFGIIFDYPANQVGNWDILGLAKRSEKWHFDMEAQERERQRLDELKRMEIDREYRERMKKLEKSLTALPPVELPKTESIKFLDSYMAVREEGALMGHCIASYAENAVKGYCYLFHVDYQNEMASVEVSPQGYVVQSYGPRDRTNSASKYGAKVLSSWGRKLKEKNQPVIRTELPGNSYTNLVDIPF